MVSQSVTPFTARSSRRNEGFRCVRLACFFSTVAVLALPAGWCNAQSSPLVVSPTLARFLTLSNDQIQTLTAQHKAWRAELSHANKAARKLTSSVALSELCTQLRIRESQVREASSLVLNSVQQQALAQLSDAYYQMPLIEAAQNLQLMGTSTLGAPASFPDGSIDVEFRYVRAAPALLPGCRANPIRPYNTQQRDGNVPSPTR